MVDILACIMDHSPQKKCEARANLNDNKSMLNTLRSHVTDEKQMSKNKDPLFKANFLEIRDSLGKAPRHYCTISRSHCTVNLGPTKGRPALCCILVYSGIKLNMWFNTHAKKLILFYDETVLSMSKKQIILY